LKGEYMPQTTEVTHLSDLWDDKKAAALETDQLALLRYRSNLLGADLRITNFGGGNTSSKITLPDPFSGKPVRVLAVKGSGGDLGSIKETGFALLYMDRLNELKGRYLGEAHEDSMVSFYPLSAFGENRVAASIDTPLHAFLPFAHVDHLHPDWAIAIAASANGKEKLAEFNREFGRNIVWLPWERPGFELALMLAEAVAGNPTCDGVLLGLTRWASLFSAIRVRVRLYSAAKSMRPWPSVRRLPLPFCPPCAALCHPISALSLIIRIIPMPWPSPGQSGLAIWARWAPVVLITFCALASAPCSWIGIRPIRTWAH
jgi:hypothetical protein